MFGRFQSVIEREEVYWAHIISISSLFQMVRNIVSFQDMGMPVAHHACTSYTLLSMPDTSVDKRINPLTIS